MRTIVQLARGSPRDAVKTRMVAVRDMFLMGATEVTGTEVVFTILQLPKNGANLSANLPISVRFTSFWAAATGAIVYGRLLINLQRTKSSP